MLQEEPPAKEVCNLGDLEVASDQEAVSTAGRAQMREALVKDHLSHRLKETSRSTLAISTQMSIISCS